MGSATRSPRRKASERALQLVPEYSPALSLQARTLREAGDLSGAREVLAQAAERSPSAESILWVVELDRLCVATVEGTLKSFVLCAEDPTSLAFSDVSVLGVRAPGEKESWVRRKGDPRHAKLRTPDAE